jgi:hypothetical protein
MIGLRLFLGNLARRPVRTLARLALDYATYVGMCLFLLLLLLSRGPLGLLGRERRRSVQHRLIEAVAWVAHG